MCRHASWVQLGTPLKIRPTGTFHLTLEYTDDSFNFLVHPNKFPHLHVETKNRGFLFSFFLRLCSLWKKQRLSPSSLLSLPCCQNPLCKKKKTRDWQFGVSGSVCLFPSFSPHKKKQKNSTLRRRDWVLRISVTISSSQGAALLRCFPLIPLKPLGPLIRKQSALMFGPLADELYLWVVWEDAEEYIHMLVCVCVCMYYQMCISSTFPPKRKKDTHTQTCRVSHTAGGMREVPQHSEQAHHK